MIDLGLQSPYEFSEYAEYDEREHYYQALCQVFKRAELIESDRIF